MMSPSRLLPFILPALLLVGCAQPPAPETETSAATDPSIDLALIAADSARSGDAETAAEQFRMLIDMNPDFPRAQTNLGLQLMKLEKYDEARQAFNKAIEQDKNDAVAYNHLGVLARRDGKFEQALDYYNKAIAADADYAAAHLNRGILLDIYLRDWPAALEEYQRYQSLLESPDPQVEKWIIDIKRRIEAQAKK